MNERTIEAKIRVGELCARLTRSFLQAESQELWPDHALCDSMLRDLHNLKGLCMAIGATKESDLIHGMESLLEETRKKSTFSDETSEKLLKGIDTLTEFSESGLLTGSSPETVSEFQAPLTGQDGKMSAAAQPVTAEHSSSRGSALGRPQEGSSKDSENFLRVQVSLLDHLMGLVSELVLIRNQLHQFSATNDDTEFLAMSQRLDVVSGGLQTEVMRMRMQPVSTVTLRLQRLVRDLGKELGKHVELHLEGNETEIDKTIIETIREPLTHVVRNALDHGIEPPEERAQSGKPQRARLVVKTYQEGGQVIVEIQDDGRGIDTSRVAKKALEGGLISSDRLSRMTTKEILSLIFLPGFSTAEKVTDVSGRGMGMDVVKSNIEQIGGVVDVSSTLGRGTNITLRIPLTLAIVPALIVHCRGLRYAIPQLKIVELVRLDSEDEAQKIQCEMLEGGPVLRLRGRLLPLLSLRAILHPEGNERLTSKDVQGSIVILRNDGHDFALAVDEVNDSIDIVVKPFVSFLKSLRIFSGATILGDGTLALILDLAGLCEHCAMDTSARTTESQSESMLGETDANQRQRLARGTNPEFLLCGIGERDVAAIPLPQVFRLEVFERKDVELTARTPVARYREGLLPLILLSKALHLSTDFQDEETIETLLSANQLDVIVTERHGRFFGIVVSHIADIIHTSSKVNELVRPNAGALGTLLEGSNVYTVVNVAAIVDTWMRDVLGEEPPMVSEHTKRALARILLVEDSNFFRKYTTSVLQASHFEVLAVSGAREALEHLRQEPENSFDAVLTDIDMPGMTGFELAKELRASDAWYKQTPIIALTSLVSQRDRLMAKAAGIDEHIEKVNLDKIPALLADVLGRLWQGIKGGAA